MSANQKKKKEAEKRRREKWKKRAKQSISSGDSYSPSHDIAKLLTLPENVRLVPSPPGMPKMSELIVELIDPFADACDDDPAAIRNLVMLGATAWNAAVYGPEKGASLVKGLVETFPPADRSTGAAILASLILRKEELFPDDRRIVYDFQVRNTEDGPRIQVASLLRPSELT